MPKRGGGRIRTWKSDDHFEHDDRVHSNVRRVSFKTGPHKGNKNRISVAAKLSLLDDDIDMGASGAYTQGRQGPYRGRGGRLHSPAPRPRPNLQNRKFVTGPLPWYKVTIPYGANHEKDVVLKTLLNHLSPEVFIPHYYKIIGNAAVFFVDDVKIAEKLFHADRKIMMSNGFRLILIVRNACPNENVDESLKEKMKLVMAKRYDPNNKALDLTKFHADPDLSDVFCALFRPLIMIAAIEIMAENIPDLVALNLNDNKLGGIDHLRRLAMKLKNLTILYLGDNRLTALGALDPLKSLPLVELYLKGNPLVNRFNDHDTYVSDVRKKFPKLARLDGIELPPAIGFDVADDSTLPPARQSFLIEPSSQDLVRDFLTQYFAIYDSESRHSLLDAYHEHAVMSMAASYLTNDSRSAQTGRLNAYIPSSRNLLRVEDREARRRYLKTGKLQVVSFLSELPKTTHDLMGFNVDLLVSIPAMLILIINGVFKETNMAGNPTRSFHRTFVIVPNTSGGFSIINDMLFVTNPSKEQEDKSFQAVVNVPAAQIVPAAPIPPAAAALPAASAFPLAPNMPPAAPVDDHAAVVSMLSQQTGMNQHWSMNCLQETGWDYQRALFIFNQLQSEGKIPQEAFVS